MVGRQFGLFDKAVAARNEQRSRDAWAAKKAIMDGDRAQALLTRLAALLDRQASVAAVHRLLANAGYVEGIATFRKRWRGGADWVQRAHFTDIDKVSRILGERDTQLEAQLRQAGEIEVEPDPMIGEPVYTLPRE